MIGNATAVTDSENSYLVEMRSRTNSSSWSRTTEATTGVWSRSRSYSASYSERELDLMVLGSRSNVSSRNGYSRTYDVPSYSRTSGAPLTRVLFFCALMYYNIQVL